MRCQSMQGHGVNIAVLVPYIARYGPSQRLSLPERRGKSIRFTSAMVFTLAHGVKRQGTRSSVVYMLNKLGNRSQTGCSHICFLLSLFSIGEGPTLAPSLSCVVELVTKTLMLTLLLCAWHGGRAMLVNRNRNQHSQIEILSKCTTLPRFNYSGISGPTKCLLFFSHPNRPTGTAQAQALAPALALALASAAED